MKKILFVCMGLLLLMSQPAMASERGSMEEAKSLALAASDYVVEHGLDAAIKEFNNPDGAFRKKDLYVFVWNYETTEMLAHGANQAMVGKHFKDMKDADGKLFFDEFKKVVVSDGEGWVDYKWPNPVTKKVELKASFVKKVNDEVLLGCGAYKD